jgi:hypothetical protein
MSKILVISQVMLVSAFLLLSTVASAASRCTKEDGYGNCIAWLITATYLPTGGGGDEPATVVGNVETGANGETLSLSKDQMEAIVERYKLPCKKAGEDSSAYAARAIAGCTRDSMIVALREYPALRYLPGGQPAALGFITSLCTSRVAEQIASSNYQSC